MKKKGRLVNINGTEAVITDMDYDYPYAPDNVGKSKFNITFNVTVNNQCFVLNFSNERLSDKNQYLADTFIGNGESYCQFLRAMENNTQLQDKNQFSEDTKNAVNEMIGAIAQSVYSHVQCNANDQD